VRIVGLLSWYDEPPRFLSRLVWSLPHLGVDHLYALDGAYDLYPDASPESSADQKHAIGKTCEQLGLPCTIVTPPRTWKTEMEKRSTLFDLADGYGTDDWLLVVDADYEIVFAHPSTRRLLAQTDRDVATVELRTDSGPYYENLPRVQSLRSLYRAGLGLTVEGNHWTYVTADGRKLWAKANEEQEHPLDLTSKLRVRHHTNLRPLSRAKAQITYYRNRDTAGIERLACEVCKVRKATTFTLADLEPIPGKDAVHGTWKEVCDVCLPICEREFERRRVELRVPVENLPFARHSGRVAPSGRPV
jgi:hypothetical protein